MGRRGFGKLSGVQRMACRNASRAIHRSASSSIWSPSIKSTGSPIGLNGNPVQQPSDTIIGIVFIIFVIVVVSIFKAIFS